MLNVFKLLSVTYNSGISATNERLDDFSHHGAPGSSLKQQYTGSVHTKIHKRTVFLKSVILPWMMEVTH